MIFLAQLFFLAGLILPVICTRDHSHNGSTTVITNVGAGNCMSFFAPCECSNTKCCGILNGFLNFNCLNLPLVKSLSLRRSPNRKSAYSSPDEVVINPCQNSQCGKGKQCHVVSTVDRFGKVNGQKAKCCSGETAAEVNCGPGLNCQSYNSDGTFTSCCEQSCFG